MLDTDTIITLKAGAYRLRERLGGSSYGVVWRAAGPQGEVALKLINNAQMVRALPQQRARWTDSARREIDFLGALAPWDERHIVRLLDRGEHERLPVMALELMAGDLAAHQAALARARRSLALSRILTWLAQINQALAKVHQYGWAYLDLKPANVLLDAQGANVKLADFGTNRWLAESRVQTYSGTASWQAPEQFFPGADGYETDPRSDYFALGAMFYYLVTGGRQLRFCSACGQVYREHQDQGASMLLARHGGRVPPTLDADEAALFVANAGGSGHPGGTAALDLLQALLSPERSERPTHALQISRMIAAIRAAEAHADVPLRACA